MVPWLAKMGALFVGLVGSIFVLAKVAPIVTAAAAAMVAASNISPTSASASDSAAASASASAPASDALPAAAFPLYATAAALAPWAAWAFRIFAGTAMFYYVVNFVDCLWRCHLLLLGLEATRGMDRPMQSQSLGEFWGKRWNKSIQSILFHACYLPLASRGWPTTGVVATFVGSAVLHVYPFLLIPSVPPLNALAMAGFFVVQFPLLQIERACGLSGSAWFFAALVATLPLFMQPTLALYDQIASTL
jgi:hypothetical protein